MPVSSRSIPAPAGRWRRIEAGHPGLLLTEPLGYLDFLSLLADAGAVLTDSGGIQEETTYLGIPCFTLRDNTERPVTIRAGTNTLLGLDPAAIAGIPAALASRARESHRATPALGRTRGRANRGRPRLSAASPETAASSLLFRRRAIAAANIRNRRRYAGFAAGSSAVGLCHLFAGRQHHAHVAALLQRLGLDHGQAVEVLEEALQQRPAPLRVGLLAPAEHDRDLDLVRWRRKRST